MIKILIPGGAGFVGMNLTETLLRLHPDWEITVWDDFSTPSSRFNLPEIQKRGITFIEGSYGTSLNDLPRDFDLIVDFAAHPSVRTELTLTGAEAYSAYLDKHLHGPLKTIFTQDHLKGYIFTSTSRIYPIDALNRIPLEKNGLSFVSSEPPIDESFPLEGYRSWYGMTKLQTELLLDELAHLKSFSVIINRCSLLTGPWQRGREEQGVYSFWLFRHFFKGRASFSPLKYFGFGGEGLQVRDILDARDYADLICQQIESILKKRIGIQTEIFNVGGGLERSWSLAQHTKLCEELTQQSLEIIPQLDTHPHDIPYYVTNYKKVAERFQWKPKIPLRQTFEDILTWAKGRPEKEFFN